MPYTRPADLRLVSGANLSLSDCDRLMDEFMDRMVKEVELVEAMTGVRFSHVCIQPERAQGERVLRLHFDLDEGLGDVDDVVS